FRIYFCFLGKARVAELADALDSKSSEVHPSCGFDSHLWHSPPSASFASRRCTSLSPQRLESRRERGGPITAHLALETRARSACIIRADSFLRSANSSRFFSPGD